MVQTSDLEKLILHAALRLQSGSFDDMLKQAEETADEDPKEALGLLTDALEIYPEERSGYAVGTLAYYHELESDYAAASLLYEEALSLSNLPEYIAKAAKASYHAGDLNRTSRIFAKAMKNENLRSLSDVIIHYLDYLTLTNSFDVSKLPEGIKVPSPKRDEARKILTQWIRNEDGASTEDDMDVRLYAIKFHIFDQAYSRAIRHADEWVEIFGLKARDKRTTDVLVQKGIALRNTSEYEEAIYAFERAIEIAEGFYDENARAELGLTYLNMGDLDTSFEILNKVADQGSLLGAIYMGAWYVANRQLRKALNYYKEFAETLSDYGDDAQNNFLVPIFNNIGTVYFNQKDYLNASRVFSESLKCKPKDAYARQMLEKANVRLR